MPIKITPKRSRGLSHLEGPKSAWEANIERKLKTWAIILYRSTKRDIQLYFRPLFENLSLNKIHCKIMQYRCLSIRKHLNFEYIKRLEFMHHDSKVMHAESSGLRRGTFLLDSTWYHSIAIFEKMHDISEEMLFFRIINQYYLLHEQFSVSWIAFLIKWCRDIAWMRKNTEICQNNAFAQSCTKWKLLEISSWNFQGLSVILFATIWSIYMSRERKMLKMCKE